MNRIAVIKLSTPNIDECLIANFEIRPELVFRALRKRKGDPFWVEEMTLVENLFQILVLVNRS